MTDQPTTRAEANAARPSFAKRARKAVVAAVVAGAGALASSLTPAIADGVFTLNELWPIVTFTIGAAIIAGAGVYAARNDA